MNSDKVFIQILNVHCVILNKIFDISGLAIDGQLKNVRWDLCVDEIRFFTFEMNSAFISGEELQSDMLVRNFFEGRLVNWNYDVLFFSFDVSEIQ